MGRSFEGRQRRLRKLKARIAADTNDHFPKCTIIGCGRPTQRTAKTGLAVSLCRKHLLHRQRHGSPWCPTPTAATLKPFIIAALAFIEQHRSDPYINAALAGLQGLMEVAGEAVIATRLRGLPPDKRAKVAVARLREAGVKPERLLAIAVAVHGLIEEVPQVCHRIKDWRICSLAKALQRLASGYHRLWEMPNANGRTQQIILHRYPRSAGRVLRYLGEMIERECELVIDHHLAAVLALKVARQGQHPAVADPLKFSAAAKPAAPR